MRRRGATDGEGEKQSTPKAPLPEQNGKSMGSQSGDGRKNHTITPADVIKRLHQTGVSRVHGSALRDQSGSKRVVWVGRGR